MVLRRGHSIHLIKALFYEVERTWDFYLNDLKLDIAQLFELFRNQGAGVTWLYFILKEG